MYDPIVFPRQLQQRAVNSTLKVIPIFSINLSYPKLKSLIIELLNKSQDERLSSPSQIQEHDFLRDYVDFEQIRAKTVEPPIRPSYSNAAPNSNFSREYDNYPPELPPIDEPINPNVNLQVSS